MEQEILKQWLTALRSGEYTQSTKRLKTDAGYCCLGVLCDLHPEGEWNVTTVPINGDLPEMRNIHQYKESGTSLPEEVVEWSGLPADDLKISERYIPKDIWYKLENELKVDTEFGSGKFAWIAALNDAGLTFAQIADILEKAMGEKCT